MNQAFVTWVGKGGSLTATGSISGRATAALRLKWATLLIATMWLSLRRWYGAQIIRANIERQLRLNRQDL